MIDKHTCRGRELYCNASGLGVGAGRFTFPGIVYEEWFERNKKKYTKKMIIYNYHRKSPESLEK